MSQRLPSIRSEPDPDNPGWVTYHSGYPGLFNHDFIGRLTMRAEGPAIARVRMPLQSHHLSVMNTVHGGAMLGFADVSLFVTMFLLTEADLVRSLTVDLQCQFLAGSIPGEPTIDAVVEILRETGRMTFLRGTMVQGDHRIAAYSATVRK